MCIHVLGLCNHLDVCWIELEEVLSGKKVHTDRGGGGGEGICNMKWTDT